MFDDLKSLKSQTNKNANISNNGVKFDIHLIQGGILMANKKYEKSFLAHFLFISKLFDIIHNGVLFYAN